MSSESPTPTSSESPTATPTAASTDDSGEGACGDPQSDPECGELTPQPSTGMFVAVNSLRQASSYKFSMTLVGAATDPDSPDAEFVYALSKIAPGSSCGSGTFTVNGTITNPQPGTADWQSVFNEDVSCPGLHIIKVGDSVYIAQGGTGTFTEQQLDWATYDLDYLSPAHVVEEYVDPHIASHYTLVGSEIKDGVSTVRYRSDEVVDQMVEGGQYSTWSADIWLAQAGGYPVSMDIVAKEADTGEPYEVKFDITNVNDPANKVTAPTT